MIGKLRNDFNYVMGADLFYLLMEACFNHAPYANAHIIYDTMTRLGAIADYRVKLVHFDHQRNDIKI